jgi:hypothetical protein
MREARRQFRVSSLNLESINFTLGLLADRMDELEGRRGTPKFKSDLDMGMNRVRSMQSGSISTDGATVVQVDAVSTEVDGVSGATSGVQNLTASATPGANRLVMSPTGSQYINRGWYSDLIRESTQQTITLNSIITYAHGEALKPRNVWAVIVCTSDELGYVTGDEADFVTGGTYGVSPVARYVSGVYCDAANVGCSLDNSIFIVDRSTNAIASITTGNWKLVLRWIL